MLEVTFAVTVQTEFVPTCPPVRLMVEPPTGAETAPEPQFEDTPPGAMVTPAGNVSLKARSETGVPPGSLLIVNVRLDVPPGPMVSGAKVLSKTGWAEAAALASAANSSAVKNTYIRFTAQLPPLCVWPIAEHTGRPNFGPSAGTALFPLQC